MTSNRDYRDFVAVHEAWDGNACDAPLCKGEGTHPAAYFVSRKVDGMKTHVRACLEALTPTIVQLMPPNEAALAEPVASRARPPLRDQVKKVV